MAKINLQSNVPLATLNANINSSVTSLTVGSGEGASFPSAPFVIGINEEAMLVTAKTTDTFTVTRGYVSTTATAHTAGDTVTHVHTHENLLPRDSVTGHYLLETDLNLNGNNILGFPDPTIGPAYEVFEDGADSTLTSTATADVNVSYDTNLGGWKTGSTAGEISFDITTREINTIIVEGYQLTDSGAIALDFWAESAHTNRIGRLAAQNDENGVLYNNGGTTDATGVASWPAGAPIRMILTWHADRDRIMGKIAGIDGNVLNLAEDYSSPPAKGNTVYGAISFNNAVVTRFAAGHAVELPATIQPLSSYSSTWNAALFDRTEYGETLHVDDQEFNNALSGNTALTVSGTNTWTVKGSRLSSRYANQTSGDITAQLWSLTPSSSPITIEAAVGLTGTLTNDSTAGIVLTDGATATDNCVFLRTYWNTNWAVSLARGTATSFDTTTWSTNTVDPILGLVYLRLIWKSSNTFHGMYSPDGISWMDFGHSDASFTMTPTHFGFATTTNGNAAERIAWCEYLRVTEANLDT